MILLHQLVDGRITFFFFFQELPCLFLASFCFSVLLVKTQAKPFPAYTITRWIFNENLIVNVYEKFHATDLYKSPTTSMRRRMAAIVSNDLKIGFLIFNFNSLPHWMRK